MTAIAAALALLVVLVAALLAAVMAVRYVCFLLHGADRRPQSRRKATRARGDERLPMKEAPPPLPPVHSSSSALSPRAEESDYANVGGSLSSRPMTIDQLRQSLSSQHERDRIKRELKMMPKRNEMEPSEAARRDENGAKNRYANVAPHDFNRVVLLERPGERGSDYINASVVQLTRSYIAAQGPLDSTVGDFWRMIAQKRVKVVVNLTRLIEDDRVACSRYWTEGDGPEAFGPFTVQPKARVDEGDFYELTMSYCDEERHVDGEVTLIHFVEWRDRAIPESQSLLKLRRRIRQLAMPTEVVVVHCSAGVGRTGTLIALDMLLDEGATTGCVDVLECVVQLRLNRPLMVQTESQYLFLHECLLEGLAAASEEKVATENAYMNVAM